MIVLRDPDTVIGWDRIDEPGDNPTWQSKCGIVEQRTFGDDATFYGFVGPEKAPIPQTFTISLISAKRAVEQEFKRTHQMTWEYEGEESRA